MKACQKRILGWILLILSLLGVFSAVAIGEYLFWARQPGGAIFCHVGLGAIALILTLVFIAEYYAGKWKHSKTKWKRLCSCGIVAIPGLVVIMGMVVSYCISWWFHWEIMITGHLVVAMLAGVIVGILLARAKDSSDNEALSE